jgi:divalent metal cation (Fe/Co/Zn/Cd) transporter
MKSIWYFVGLLLAAMGVIITVSAVHSLVRPPAQPKVLSHLHPDLWWGIIMLVFGLAFALFNRRSVDR